MKFTYWQSKKNGQWYWNLQSTNGQIIADGSEGYDDENSVKIAIDRIRNVAAMARIEKVASK